MSFSYKPIILAALLSFSVNNWANDASDAVVNLNFKEIKKYTP